MKEGKKVKASLYITMDVECPSCEKSIDLFSDIDRLNNEGQLWHLLEVKTDATWTNIDKEFKCPHCSVDLIFDELEY